MMHESTRPLSRRPVCHPVRPLLALALALPLLPFPPAAAQEVTADGAARLERLLEGRLARLARGPADRYRLERAPDAGVRAEGGAYAVTLPDLRLVTPGGWLLEAPVVQARVTPQPDGGWAWTASLPATLAVFGPQGFRAGEVTLGERTLEGRWTADLETLEALDLRLARILFTPREGSGRVSVGQISARLTPEIHQDGKWTGPASLSISDVQARTPAGAEQLALKSLSVQAQISGLDTARYAEWNAAMAARAAADDGREGLSPAEARALAAALPHLDGMLGQLKATVQVSGLRRLGEDGGRTSLADGSASLTLTGLASEKAGLDLSLRHKGLALDGPGIRSEQIPASGEVRLAASGLPRRALLQAYAQRLEQTPALGEAGARKAFEQQALAALGRAGAELTLSKLVLDAAEAGLSGSGTLHFTDTSPRGLTGSLALALRGLDGLITRASAANAGDPGRTLALYALQGLGRPETDGQGRTVQSYRVEIGADGRILLNGNDSTALVQGLLSLR